MAQRVNATNLRLGLNVFWSSQWYSKTNYSYLFFEDILIKFYFKNIFEKRGYFFKRAIIKRSNSKTFIFLEVYGNPYFEYIKSKRLQKIKRFSYIIQKSKIKYFLSKLSKNKTYLSIFNLFMYNRIHRLFSKRLKMQYNKFRYYKFTNNILSIFSIILKTKGASFFANICSYELEVLEKRKKNKLVYRFTYFIQKIVKSIGNKSAIIHGMRVQLKGRFKGRKRPKILRFREGMVPFNTFRAIIDYGYAVAITINGSFGIKVWICYRNIL